MKKLILLLFIPLLSLGQDPLNNTTIYSAVQNWLVNPSSTQFTDENNSPYYGHISDWDTSQVTDMSELFYQADEFNEPLNNWDVSNVITMQGMFSHASSFNQPLDNWDVSSVLNISGMFRGGGAQVPSVFNQPLNNWDVSNVTNMFGVFEQAISFNQPLNNWDVSNVSVMSYMFNYATSFNQPLDNWDVSNVVEMQRMFREAEAFNQNINSWDVSNVTQIDWMFANANNFNQPLNNWDVSNVVSMNGVFAQAISFNQPLNNWNISNVENLDGFFYLTSLTTENLDVTLNGWAVLDLDLYVTDGDLFLSSVPPAFCNSAKAIERLWDYGIRANGGVFDCSSSTPNPEYFDYVIDCDGSELEMSYCYENSDGTSLFTDQLLFMSNDGSPLNFILDGQLEGGYDEFHLEFSGAALIINGEFGDWTYFYIDTSTLGSNFQLDSAVRLVIDSDQIGSCDTNWDVCEPTTINVSCASNLSLEENIFEISLYPNPTTNYVHINSDVELKAVVFDLLGRQVMREYVIDKIDISSLEEGTYIINLTDGLNTFTQKIIKK